MPKFSQTSHRVLTDLSLLLVSIVTLTVVIGAKEMKKVESEKWKNTFLKVLIGKQYKNKQKECKRIIPMKENRSIHFQNWAQITKV